MSAAGPINVVVVGEEKQGEDRIPATGKDCADIFFFLGGGGEFYLVGVFTAHGLVGVSAA